MQQAFKSLLGQGFPNFHVNPPIENDAVYMALWDK